MARNSHRSDVLGGGTSSLMQHPLLSSEEEYELAIRGKRGDRAARDKIIRCHQRFVLSVVKQMFPGRRNYDDLIQQGNLGLMEAWERFDPDFGNRFKTYAAYWVRSAVQRSTDLGQPIVGPKCRATRELLTAVNGEEGAEVAASHRFAVFAQGKYRVSMDDVAVRGKGPQRDLKWSDVIPAPDAPSGEDVVDRLRDEAVRDEVWRVTSGMSRRDRRIVEQRLLVDEPMTLEELGAEFGVSRERIRQLEAKAIDKLRVALKDL